jgi:acetyl esterase
MDVYPRPVAPLLSQIDDEIAQRIAAGPSEPLDLTVPRAARAISARRAAERNRPRAHREKIDVQEHRVPAGHGRSIAVRAYVPREPLGPLPALVYFHGGAFMLGDLETDDRDCRLTCVEAGCIVLSVDYRLAPEHPFPAGVEDAFRAFEWAAGEAATLGIDRERLAVGGASAGGCLAAAVALMARDNGGPAVAFQQLIYPVLDDRIRTGSSKWRETPAFDHGQAVLMWELYLAGSDRRDLSPYAAPARAENLTGLAPAYILAAGVDPLRDEALEYGLRLLDAGVPVELHHLPGAIHGFDKLGETDLGRRATGNRNACLRSALKRPRLLTVG